MEIGSHLLFFFSFLGVFNGIVLSAYFLFFAKPRNFSNRLMGLLLLALIIRVGKSVFYYFNPQLSKIYLQIGLTGCVFIGPLLFLYIKSIVRPASVKKEWYWHILPVAVLILVVGIMFPYSEYPSLWRNYIIVGGIYKVWLLYIILSGWLLRSYLSNLFKQPFDQQRAWVLSVFAGNALIWIAYNTTSYTSYIAGALSFSVVFYLLLLQLIFIRREKKKRDVKGKKKIATDEVTQIIEKLEQVMTEEKPYQNPNLKLPELAKKINTSVHTLSQVLNDNLDKNFTMYINEYRVNEAKDKLRQNANLTIESIAYDAGFNSTSTFYTAFKKVTATTPAQFKKAIEME